MPHAGTGQRGIRQYARVKQLKRVCYDLLCAVRAWEWPDLRILMLQRTRTGRDPGTPGK